MILLHRENDSESDTHIPQNRDINSFKLIELILLSINYQRKNICYFFPKRAIANENAVKEFPQFINNRQMWYYNVPLNYKGLI